MIIKQNPSQRLLFTKFDSVLCKSARRILDNGWQGVFRRVILKLLPVEKLEEDFSKTMGRPTKELYSVCGWIFGETSPMKRQRRGKLYTTEEQMDYDMRKMMELFCGNHKISNMDTCSEKNDVQLIMTAIPQGGSASDMNSLPEVEENLKKKDHLPEEFFADGRFTFQKQTEKRSNS